MSDFETSWRELISGANRQWWAPAARSGLSVLSGLYGGVVAGYRLGFDLGMLKTHTLRCPVVSVGNLTVGGTGKTTTVRWLIRRLAAWGVRPAVLSYGYRAGGTRRDPDAVHVVAGPDGIREPVEVSGDEPQLLARSLPGVPVLIGKKRVLSGERACREFAVDVCVLDDAFQYWRLRKDLEIVLMSGANPFGYGRLLPRGMLRESPGALRRADAVVVTHAGWIDAEAREKLRNELRRRNPRLVVAEARHVPVALRDHATGERVSLEELRKGHWLAVSSLGQPESFERTLMELQAGEISPARFRDHHPYTEEDVRALCRRVEREALTGVVTTEKDAVKIPPTWFANTRCCVLEIDLEFLSGQNDIESLLRARVAGAN